MCAPADRGRDQYDVLAAVAAGRHAPVLEVLATVEDTVSRFALAQALVDARPESDDARTESDDARPESDDAKTESDDASSESDDAVLDAATTTSRRSRIDRAEIDLHHHVLPKLDHANLVAYDPATGEVRDVAVPTHPTSRTT